MKRKVYQFQKWRKSLDIMTRPLRKSLPKKIVRELSYEVESLLCMYCIYTPEMRGSYAIRAMKGRLLDDEAQSKKNRK